MLWVDFEVCSFLYGLKSVMHLHLIALRNYYYSLDGTSVVKTICQWRFLLSEYF